MAELTFYFDRCLGKALPEALRLLSCPFEVRDHFKEGFAPTTPDDEWLTIVGKKKWIVFTHDAKWTIESAPIEAIKQHKVGCFYLYGASSLGWFKLRSLAHNFEKIQKICKTESPPYIYRVSAYNRLSKVL